MKYNHQHQRKLSNVSILLLRYFLWSTMRLENTLRRKVSSLHKISTYKGQQMTQLQHKNLTVFWIFHSNRTCLVMPISIFTCSIHFSTCSAQLTWNGQSLSTGDKIKSKNLTGSHLLSIWCACYYQSFTCVLVFYQRLSNTKT